MSDPSPPVPASADTGAVADAGSGDPPRPWHALQADEVLGHLGADGRQGLGDDEARRRLERHGPNRLPEEEGEGPLMRFLKRFHNVLIYILLVAAVVTAALGEWIDTGVIAAVALAFAEFPVTPAQILWVNMIMAVTLALALAFEPPEAGIMERPPRSPDDAILSRFLLRRIVYVSVLVAVGCILLFHWTLGRGHDLEYARTVVVNSLVAAQLWYLFNCRFQWRPSVGWKALVGNRAVLAAAGLLIVFQGAFTYLPFMNTLFRTQGLSAESWGPVLLVGLVLYLVVESEKALGRRRIRREEAAVGHRAHPGIGPPGPEARLGPALHIS